MTSLLDLKTLFFYPSIIASIIWSIYSAVQIGSFISYMRNEYPECAMPNENRNIIFFSTISVLAFVQRPIETISKRVFIVLLPEKKFPLNSALRDSKA